MQRNRSTTGRITTAWFVLLATLVLVVGSASASQAADEPIVIGLGDSVAAGYGAGPPADASPCGRSTEAYPTLVATRLALTGYNMSCAGATAAAGLNNPETRNGVTIPSQISQLDSLSKKSMLVSVTIGANDVHWLDFLKLCLQATPDCNTVANTQAFHQYLRDATIQINRAIRSILIRKPAQVDLTGYYDPLGVLASGFGLTNGEITWYRARLAELNTALHLLAIANHVQYVSLMSLNAAIGDVIVNPTSYFGHPTAQGQTKIADLITASMSSSLAA